MPFKKGESGNPQGRPPGAKNKASEALREKIEDFITSKMDEIENLWEGLENKDKASFITKLLDFALPKLRAMDTNLNISSMSEAEIDELTDSLISKLKSND